VIVHEDDAGTVNARAGEWFVWLGGAVDEVGSISSPTIEVPADTGWITVSGYRYLVYDSTTSIDDWTAIALYQDDTWYEDFFFWDNYEFDNLNWFYFEASGPGEFYAGMSFEFTVEAVTDATSDDMTPTGQTASNFFFDDISFISSRCIEPPQ
jgi:hypothetical protein